MLINSQLKCQYQNGIIPVKMNASEISKYWHTLFAEICVIGWYLQVNDSEARYYFRVNRLNRIVIWQRRYNPLGKAKLVIRICALYAAIALREAHIRISDIRTYLAGFGYIFSHIFNPHAPNFPIKIKANWYTSMEKSTLPVRDDTVSVKVVRCHD